MTEDLEHHQCHRCRAQASFVVQIDNWNFWTCVSHTDWTQAVFAPTPPEPPPGYHDLEY
jgi:hypothetical protein